MTLLNLKSVGRTDAELKQLLEAAIEHKARIFAIIMEDAASSERSINYRFSLEESQAILRAIYEVLQVRLSKIDLSKEVRLQANPDAVVEMPVIRKGLIIEEVNKGDVDHS